MTLTPEQIENWRELLVGMIGPYALIMPAEKIQQMRDEFQRKADLGKDSSQSTGKDEWK
jgi:hypothetical protein